MGKLFVSMLLGLSLSNVLADEILLKNGDRITGTVVNKSGGKLVVKTDYAGKISISWSKIATLKTDNPIAVMLFDKQKLKGKAVAADDGAFGIQSDGLSEPLPVPLSTVKDINPKRFVGQANFGGLVARGNTDRQAFHLDAELIARGKNNRLTIGGAYNQTADDGTESSNNLLATINYDHFFSEKWYGYVHTSFNRDKFQDLNLRTAVGPGMGYQIWETDLTNLSFEAGPDYVIEDFDQGEDRSFAAGRWTLKYDRWLFDKFTQFFHVNEGHFSFEDTSDVYVRTRTGFRLPLRSGFQLTAEYDLDYDTKPAANTKKTDTRYLLNLGYGW